MIEDDPSISQLLRVVLEGDGHEVLVADDGSRGLAMATRRHPDAVVLDIMMPFMDGFAVLEAIRSDERCTSLPVMMLSAMQQESIEERCYRLGAQAFVRKPFEPELLLGLLQELVEDPPAIEAEKAAEQPQPREVPLAVTLAWRGGA